MLSSPLSIAYQIIPTTEAPSQTITIALGGQACVINIFTKSVNIPVLEPREIASDPTPRYENANPCFMNVFTNSGANLIIGGVYVRHASPVVFDTYLNFVGDLMVFDTSGAAEDPTGVPPRLPPKYLRNATQRAEFPLSLGDRAPPAVAGRIPGMGSRFILTWWPPGTYVAGYSLPV